ncbi:MAG: hypothetical protein ACM3O6_01550, partial [Acidobacteriota bacterium]
GRTPRVRDVSPARVATRFLNAASSSDFIAPPRPAPTPFQQPQETCWGNRAGEPLMFGCSFFVLISFFVKPWFLHRR